jgi:hypothetical protein
VAGDDQPAGTDRRPTAILVAASAAMLAFAVHRVPFDDEWYSITLAGDTTWDAFWRSIASDPHPPYVALLDRATVALTHSTAAITVVHTLASIAAMALLASLARSIGLSRLSMALALLHPIVFMYGGAARWYPFALLADALRAWALWSRGSTPTSGRRSAAFVAGATIGVAAGYADAILVAVDAAWLLGRALRGPASAQPRLRRHAVIVVAVAATGVLATLLASPVFVAHVHLTLAGVGPLVSGKAPLGFVGLGLVGEAMLPPPWTFVAAVALAGYVAVAARTWRQPGSLWIASVAAGWLLATQVGVWHPRYALMLWTLLTARVIELAIATHAPSFARWAARATAAWLGVGLLLTLGERSFVKADLNAMGRDGCDAIFATPSDLVVAPYPRTAMQIARVCAPQVPVVTAGWVRHYEAGDPALTASIADALPRAHEVVLVTVPTRGSSLEDTFEQVRGLLEARCTERSSQPAVVDPFGAWKAPDGSRGTARYRYEVTRYACR